MAVNEWPEHMIAQAQDVFGRPEGRMLSRDEAIQHLNEWALVANDFLQLYRDGLRLDSEGGEDASQSLDDR